MSAIERAIKPLSDWYQNSSSRQFVDWWLKEMKTFIPTQYQEQLFKSTRQLYLVKTDAEYALQQLSVQGLENWQNEAGLDETSWWHRVSQIKGDFDGEMEVILLLPEEHVLYKRVALPMAAINDIEAVLTYELDKYIPYPVDQVVFTFRLGQVIEGHEKAPVDLYVVRKDVLNRAFNEVNSKGIGLSGIDAMLTGAAGQARPAGVNFLDNKMRVKKDNGALKFNVLLLVMFMALLAFVMFNSLQNKRNRIETLNAQVEDLKVQARQARMLQQTLSDSIIAAQFLGNKRQQTPRVTGLLTELTSAVPKNTYLTRIIVNEERVEIVGQSDNANALIPILDKSAQWYSPEVSGQISPNPRTNKETFTIKAALKPAQEEDHVTH